MPKKQVANNLICSQVDFFSGIEHDLNEKVFPRINHMSQRTQKHTQPKRNTQTALSLLFLRSYCVYVGIRTPCNINERIRYRRTIIHNRTHPYKRFRPTIK